MPDATLKIFAHNARMGIAAAGNLAILRLYAHPEPRHFEVIGSSIRTWIGHNKSPIGGILVVPREEKSLPGRDIIDAFVALLKEHRGALAAGAGIVEPQVGKLGSLIRIVLSSHLIILGRDNLRLFAGTSEALPWLIGRTPVGQAGAASVALGQQMCAAVELPPPGQRAAIRPPP